MIVGQLGKEDLMSGKLLRGQLPGWKVLSPSREGQHLDKAADDLTPPHPALVVAGS